MQPAVAEPVVTAVQVVQPNEFSAALQNSNSNTITISNTFTRFINTSSLSGTISNVALTTPLKPSPDIPLAQAVRVALATAAPVTARLAVMLARPAPAV